MSAAEEPPPNLHSMPDDLALAMLADRSHLLDRALKAVEGVSRASRFHKDGLIVIIPADFALCHGTPPGSTRKASHHAHGMLFLSVK
jgi:hypothetical protein